MKQGDLVKIYRNHRTVDLGCGVVVDARPAKYVPGNIYVIFRDGKEEWYDDTWDLEVICEAE